MEIEMDTQFTQRSRNDYPEGLTSPLAQPDSAVAWRAVFAGAVASAALSLILLLLGTGFGLTLVSPWSGEGISGASFGTSSIVGVILISLLASAIGGYLAGRLRTRWLNTPADEVFFRDTAHGFLSWSVATLSTAALLGTVAGTIVSGGIKTGATVAGSASTVAGGAAAAVAAYHSNDNGTDAPINTPLPYLLDSLLRHDNNTPFADNSQSQINAQNSLDTAISPATNSTYFSAHNSLRTGELARIFINAMATGTLPENDLEYAGQLVAQQTGIDQPTAKKRVADTFTALQTKLSETEITTKEAADKAREVSAYTSLWLFISLLIGAFIASLMAVYGGRQRDL
jgi:hypothetical protein